MSTKLDPELFEAVTARNFAKSSVYEKDHPKFGTVHATTTDWCEHHAAEIEYYDSTGRMIGYWSYGNWDYDLPYNDKTK